MKKITWNSPVILSFALISLIALGLNKRHYKLSYILCIWRIITQSTFLSAFIHTRIRTRRPITLHE